MASNTKPYSGQVQGGPGNLPLMQDGTGTPITSPFTAAKDLVVPATAFRLNLVQNLGTTGFTVRLKSAGSGVYGTATIPNGVLVSFDCAGMGATTATFPTIFTVTPGTDGSVSFWFDCTTEAGE
jgi:hypothetical protein